MKTMKCHQLGGPCDAEFQAESFEEIAELSRRHGQAMAEAQDQAHLSAMQGMVELMQDPTALSEWMEGKKREFEASPETE